MKKLRLLGLCLLMAGSAFTLTSCLNDDDNDNSATPAEIQQMFSVVQGSHSGRIYAMGKDFRALTAAGSMPWEKTSRTASL